MTACRRKICLRSVYQWLCSAVCQSACKCSGLDFLVYLSGFLLVGVAFCSPWVFDVGLRIFDLRNLGSGRSKSVSVRTQIHLMWPTWQFCGGVYVSLFFRTGFVTLRRRMMTQGLSSALVVSISVIFLWSLSVGVMCPTYPSCQTSWFQCLCRFCWKRRGWR